MGIQTTFDFDSAVNFNLSNSQIQSGKAKLAIVTNPGQVFSQAFDSDSGFTYDNTKAEFTGGVVRQKSQLQNGSFTGIVGANVVGNSITKTAGTSWGNSGAISTQQISGAHGFVEFKAGQDADNLVCGLANSDPSGDFSQLDFGVYFQPGGLFGILQNGSSIGPTGSYTTGDTFRVALENNVVKYYKNGVLHYTSLVSPTGPLFFATTIYTTGASVTDITILTGEFLYLASTVVLPAFSYTGLGTIQAVESSTVTETGAPRYIVADKYFNGSAWVNSNGSYAQANTSAEIITNLPSLTVQGAGSLVVKALFTDSNTLSNVDLLSVTVTGQKYAATGYLEPVQPLQIQALISYVQSATLPGSTTAKIILKIDGMLKYHNGTAWVNSDGSSAQANLASELDAAFEDLNLGQNSTVYLRWVLATPSNTDTPELDSATLEYDFGAVTTVPTKCLVYGYLRDISGNPVADATVNFKMIRPTSKEYKEASANVIFKTVVSTTSDENGYFEMELIRSSEYEGKAFYTISVSKDTLQTSLKGTNSLRFEVPDADTKDITDLLEAS